MFSFTEENYLKAIYRLGQSDIEQKVSTNQLAEATQTKPASVSDMLKKLADKGLIFYKKYQGVTLTEQGEKVALNIIRKHRLWEVFLVSKLGFGWHEIHEIAEELEHIQSDILIERLDYFLGHPEVDPHGDPIPNAEGVMPDFCLLNLSEAPLETKLIVMNVSEDSPAFLQHLDMLEVKLNSELMIHKKSDFDGSIFLSSEHNKALQMSQLMSNSIWVRVKS